MVTPAKAAYMAEWRARNAEHRRAYRAAYRAAHLEQEREVERAYIQTQAGKERNRRSKANSLRTRKAHAREAVRRAVVAGRLQRTPCFCGMTQVQGHHHRGYEGDARLDVVWLCSKHHAEAHGRGAA